MQHSSVTDGWRSVAQEWTPANVQHHPPRSSIFSTSFGSSFESKSDLSIPPVSSWEHTPSKQAIDDSFTLIGSVHYHGLSGKFVFKCNDLRCNHKTFGRWFDLRRHHEGRHVAAGPIFWCHVDGCARSDMDGGRSFPRKDKLAEHVRKVHKDTNCVSL